MYPYRRSVSCLAALTVTFGLSSVAAGAAEHGRTLGFIVTKFSPAIYKGAGDCPDGLTPSVKEAFLESQSPAERKRLELPENATELREKFVGPYLQGPNGEDICSDAREFIQVVDPKMYPLFKTVKGHVSYGFNLDGTDGTGASAPNTCQHEKFVSPDGTPGIDNQLYRVEGCALRYRGTDTGIGGMINTQNKAIKLGTHSYLIEIKGVDDLRNSPNVEVGIYGNASVPMIDTFGDVLPDGSMTISDNPHWQNIVHGRIVNGVLTTDAADIRLSNRWIGFGGLAAELEETTYKSARFRLELTPDGRSLKGHMGAYQDIHEVTAHHRYAGKGAAIDSQVNCAAEYRTLLAFADGYPDAKTGKCTAVSLDYDVAAVPAFLFHQAPQKTAAAAADKVIP